MADGSKIELVKDQMQFSTCMYMYYEVTHVQIHCGTFLILCVSILAGLKTVIGELPPASSSLAANICRRITGRLTNAISKVSNV